MKDKSNVVLIGMPGCGKSTTGIILAKQLAFGFIDSDLLIELAHGSALENILLRRGYQELRHIEEQILLEMECRHHVIATGGSAVYSSKAMSKLAETGVIIYLEAEFDDLKQRVGDMDQRGVARPDGHTFRDVYDERTPLYEANAEIKVNTRFKSQDQVATEIAAILAVLKG